MKTIEQLIIDAADVLPPVWSAKKFIADNPLQGLEAIPFDEAISHANHLFSTSASSAGREMIKWCQAYFDEGQAKISMPGKENGLYRSWHNLVHPALPSDLEEAISFSLNQLHIPNDQWEKYLRSILLELPGWAGYAKQKGEVKNYIALKLALKVLHGNEEPKRSFHPISLLKLQQKEEAYRKHLLKEIKPAEQSKEPYDAQFIFCLDVRSEPYRRKIEAAGKYETFGTAGFFGLPLQFIDEVSGKKKEACPAILKPELTVKKKRSRPKILIFR